MQNASRKPDNRAEADMATVQHRIDRLDWDRIVGDLEMRGFATMGPLLAAGECTTLAGLYDRDDCFRSRILMARHGFGLGEYKYFGYPLPEPVSSLRTSFYEKLVPVANGWAAALKMKTRYPNRYEEMIARCHAAGQRRPTPLLLKYQADDYNCLHQDLYGEQVFPLQITFLLSRPHVDFEGGEFLLVEQRPRMQSRAEVVPLVQGEGVIFAVHYRPSQGKRGTYRVTMRHGISRLRWGCRFAMGVIFHDAA